MRGSVPEKFLCWKCKPRSAPEKERAVRFQQENLGLDDPKRPGGKHRRTSAAAMDGGKRKRRLSVVQPTTPQVAAPLPAEEEHVEVEEFWTRAYVHIYEDIVSNHETRVKLRRQAHHWRGVTAIADPPPTPIKFQPVRPTTHLRLAYQCPDFLQHSHYALQILDYTLSILSFRSTQPFVHLIGPLDVALDSRPVGNCGGFVRSGCHPNAVLRPMLCDRDMNKPDSSANTPRSFNSAPEKEDDGTALGFGVFALRNLKTNEEVVSGWG